MKRRCSVCQNFIEDLTQPNCPYCGTAVALTTAWHNTAWHDTTWHDTTWRDIPAVDLSSTDVPFFDDEIVSMADLAAMHYEETTYATIGGGIGSFVWVDTLRIAGVPADAIVALGTDEKPYGRWKMLCDNAQTSPQERIRSDSGSTPDNIWGFPGYALREAVSDTRRGQIKQAVSHLWQVFAELVASDVYTPRAQQVYDSIDREAARIGWYDIWRFGRVRALRKSDDGRYVILYARGADGFHSPDILIANYVHIAVGYPGVRFLPDLQAYRQESGDSVRVVNAYEDHAHIYEHLAAHGGTVMLRGRGITSSRIIQRIDEVRQAHPERKIHVIHLMRSQRVTPNEYEHTAREVEHHFELQAFNFPRSAFGGELKDVFAKGNPHQRAQLIDQWGGVTTSTRSDWREMIERGLAEGWYQPRFGEVKYVSRYSEHDLAVILHPYDGNGEEIILHADYIIDATGLNTDHRVNPFICDLIERYRLILTEKGGIKTTPNFEIKALRRDALRRDASHRDGRVYISGITTIGGDYAPVDSFLGLQYAALKSVDELAALGAPYVGRIAGWRSVVQWTRWLTGGKPT